MAPSKIAALSPINANPANVPRYEIPGLLKVMVKNQMKTLVGLKLRRIN